MDSFQPGLDFSPVNPDETVLRLHGSIQPRLTKNLSLNGVEFSARAETVISKWSYFAFLGHLEFRLCLYRTCVRPCLAFRK